MDILNYQNLTTIIPISVILSLTYFLIKFFGKAYSDQVPFADNRSWHEELFGISFFSSQVLSPAISVLLLFSKGSEFWHFKKEDWILLGVSALLFISSLIISKKSNKFFSDDNFYEGNYFSSLKKISNPDNKEINDSDKIALLKTLFFPSITILIMWSVLVLCRLGAYYHLIGALIVLFFYLTTLALMFSLVKRHILKANIYFISKEEEKIEKCRVIKVNNDNVKVRTDDGKFIIINKACILKIEFIENLSKKLIEKPDEII